MRAVAVTRGLLPKCPRPFHEWRSLFADDDGEGGLWTPVALVSVRLSQISAFTMAATIDQNLYSRQLAVFGGEA